MSRVAFFNNDKVERLFDKMLERNPPSFEQAGTMDSGAKNLHLPPLPRELGVPFGCSDAHGGAPGLMEGQKQK